MIEPTGEFTTESDNTQSTKEIKKRVVDPDELAEKISPVASLLRNEVRTRDLFIRPKQTISRQSTLERLHSLAVNPPPEWIALLNELPSAERAYVMSAVGIVVKIGKHANLGELRSATLEDFIGKEVGGPGKVSPRRAAFIMSSLGVPYRG